MLKKTILLLCVFTAVFTVMGNAQDTGPYMGIIPAPVSLKKIPGEFILSQKTIVLADSLENKAVLFLMDYLQNKAMLHVQLKQNYGSASESIIVLTSAGAENLPVDGYHLTITPPPGIVNRQGRGAILWYTNINSVNAI